MERTDATCRGAAGSQQPLNPALGPFHVRTVPSTGAASGRDQPKGPLWPGFGFRRVGQGDKRSLLQAVPVCQPGTQPRSGGGPERSAHPGDFGWRRGARARSGLPDPGRTEGTPRGSAGLFRAPVRRDTGEPNAGRRSPRCAGAPETRETSASRESFRYAGRDHQGSTNPSPQTRERFPGPQRMRAR